MDNTINVVGKEYRVKKIKAKNWREIFKFEEERKDILIIDFIDKHCEVIAGVLEGVTAEELQENLSVEEVMQVYSELVKYLLRLLTEKADDEKNGENGENVDQG